MFKKIVSVALLALMLVNGSALAAGRIQGTDVKSLTEITAAGGTAANLIGTSKIYDEANAQQLSTSITNGQLGGSGSGGKNYLSNGSFEGGVASPWSMATGSVASDSTNYFDGSKSAQVTLSAQAGVFSQDVTPTSQLSNVQMVASCYVKTSLTTIQVCSRLGGTDTNCVAVPSTNTWQPVQVSFIGPSSGTMGVSVKATSSSTGTYNVDQCYVGPAGPTSQIPGAVLMGTISMSGSSCSWGPNSSASFADFSATTTCSYTTTGTAQAPATQIPAIKFASLPAGEYKLEAEGYFMANGASPTVAFQFWDGTNTARETSWVYQSLGTGNIAVPSINQSISYSTAQSNVTFSIRSKKATGTGAYIGAGNDPLVIRVYWIPTQSQQFYAAQNTPASWSGSLQVGGTCTNSSATYADFSSCGALTLTGITSRNISAVANASALPGIDVTFPRAGIYNVCAVANVYNATSSATGGVKLVDGSGTDLTKGLQTYLNGTRGGVSLCGQYSVSAPGVKTIKMQGATNTGSIRIIGDLSGGNAIDWSIIELDAPMAMPFLQGNVSSSSLGSERIERFSSNGVACTSGTCAGSGTPGISSVTWGSTGTYTVNFAAGTFSAAPSCFCIGSTGGICMNNVAPTTSSWGYVTRNTSNANSNDWVNVMCIGPR